MSELARAMWLVAAIAAHSPRGGAEAHVAAAFQASSRELPAEVLLAVAIVESDMDSTATSRVAGGRRRVGSWPSSRPAGTGPRFCGVMQAVAGFDWSTCLALRDLSVGYEAGAAELRYWLRRSRGDLAAALRGHACGNAGLAGPCRAYDRRVLAEARRLRW